MNYYTADLHFGHANIIKLNNRPFSSVDQMDDTIITNWNKTVKPDDHVYIIGDFAFRNNSEPKEYFDKLNGHKHLIIGNHDKAIQHDSNRRSYLDSMDQIKTIQDGNRTVVLCHYPLLEWDGMYRDTWHIFGHIHNNTNDTYTIMKQYRPKALNAGVDITHFKPVTFDELIKLNEEFKKNH